MLTLFKLIFKIYPLKDKMDTRTSIIEEFRNQLDHIILTLGNHNKEVSDLKSNSCNVDDELNHLNSKQKDLGDEILRLKKEIQLKNTECKAINIKVNKCNEVKLQNAAAIERVRSKIRDVETQKSSLKVKIRNEFQRQIAELKTRFAPFSHLYAERPLAESAVLEKDTAPIIDKRTPMVKYANSPQTYQIPIPFKHIESMGIEKKLDDVALMYLLREEIKGKEADFLVADTNCYPLKRNGNYKSCCKYFMREEYAKVLIPINLRPGTKYCHWTLIFLNKASKQINYYDSLHQPGGHILKEFNAMVKEYIQSRRECSDNSRNFDLLDTPDNHPCQTINSYDCGFHVIMAARKIVQDEPIKYSEEDVNALRHMSRYKTVMGYEAVSLEVAFNLNWRTLANQVYDDKDEQGRVTGGREKRFFDVSELQDQDSTPKRQKH